MPHFEWSGGSMWAAAHRMKTASPYPPVMLVHGAGSTHQDWPAELRRLPDCRVLAVDLPGHGNSVPPGRDSIAAYAADVADLLAVLELPPAVVIGHSMGAAIALTLALSRPERVAGLVLIGGGAKLRVHPDILHRVLVDPEHVYSLLADWLWADETPVAVRELTRQRMRALDPVVVHGDYLACNAFDVLGALGQIAVPTLVVGGEADRMTPLKFSQTLADGIPQAELVVVPGAGHMLHLERPEVVSRAISAWLERFVLPAG